MADFRVQYIFSLTDRFSAQARKVARASQGARKNVHGLGRDFNVMERGASSAGRAVDALARRLRSLRTVGRTLGGGGGMMAGISGGMGAYGAARAVKRFADYETALVNIRKVWTGSEREYTAMVKRLQQLNSRVPLTRAQIAGTLEQSLRAGVADDAKGLIEATEQFARMGVAFNIPAEQAAVLFSKLRSALSMTTAEFEKFGDTANTVANKFPMSEMELFEILRRQAALGKAISGKQGAYDVLTIGAAQLAVGTPKEVAATGLRTLLARLNTQPKDTQKALKALGLGSKEVKTMLTKDLFGTVRAIMGKIAKLPNSERAGILAQLAGMKSFDAFSRLIANVKKLDEVRSVVDAPFRLTAMSEYQRKLKTMNAALQITRNTLADFADSMVRYWEKPIRNGLKWIRQMSGDLKGNPWIAWTAGAYALLSAAAMVLLPLGMLAWSLSSLAAVVAVAARPFMWLARVVAAFGAGMIGAFIAPIARAAAMLGAGGALMMGLRLLGRFASKAIVLTILWEGAGLLMNWEKVKASFAEPMRINVIWPEAPPWLKWLVAQWGQHKQWVAGKGPASALNLPEQFGGRIMKLMGLAKQSTASAGKLAINPNTAQKWVSSTHAAAQRHQAGAHPFMNNTPIAPRSQDVNVTVTAPPSIMLTLPNGAVAGKITLGTERNRGDASTSSAATETP